MAITRMRKNVLRALAVSIGLVVALAIYLDHSLRNLDLSEVAVYKEGVGPGSEEAAN
jgi:hypothetical protein